MNLTTDYLGIELKNPIIVGACNLVTTENNLRDFQEAGAAAVVYKSLFEEQLHLNKIDSIDLNKSKDSFDMRTISPSGYINELKKARKILNKIPLFASINAVYEDSWIDIVNKIEKTGVDGLELNFYSVPRNLNSLGIDEMQIQFDMLKKIREATDLPIAVKLSPYYSNILGSIRNMDDIGAEAFVLFNRFFQPDIDLEKEEIFFPYNLSDPNGYKVAMRFVGLLYDRINADLCASNGIYSGFDVAKLILSGASSVQIVSSIYKNGIGHINTILTELQKWMNYKSYKSINDIKGKLSSKNIDDPFAYNRAQYIDIIMNNVEIKKHLSLPDNS